jgi:hypothetical protein
MTKEGCGWNSGNILQCAVQCSSAHSAATVLAGTNAAGAAPLYRGAAASPCPQPPQLSKLGSCLAAQPVKGRSKPYLLCTGTTAEPDRTINSAAAAAAICVTNWLLHVVHTHGHSSSKCPTQLAWTQRASHCDERPVLPEHEMAPL